MAATIVEKPAELFGIDGQPQEFRIKVAGEPHPTLQWQKGKFLKIKEGPRYHVFFDEETKEDVMVIKELRPADAGTYKCNVFNPGGQANCAVVLHVKDRKDISEEEVLKILEKTDPKDYERVALMYGITDFRNLLKHVHIKKKKPAEIVKELEDVEGQQEGDVTFMAEVIINDKDLKVEWEKNLDILTPGQKYKMEHKGNLVMLTIKDLRHDDEGKYKLVIGDCTSSAMLAVKKAPARFRGLMKGCTVFLHERAEFTVEVSRPDAEIQWFFKGKPIDFTTKRYAIETMGNRRTLVIRRTEFEDMGEYSCSTGDDKSTAKLTVKEERYKFTSELRDCEVPVGGDARFECEVSSPSAKVTWFRNKEELTAGEKYQIIKDGLKHVLIIKNIEMEKDRGQYICKTKDGNSTAKLIIREPPPGFVSELRSLTGFFKKAVTLECEVAKEDVRVKWFKNGKEINLAKLKGKYDCQIKGTRRILIINNLLWDDTAEYTCEAPGGKTSCTMTVEEAPIEFKQQLKDSKAFPKESVTFECELSTEETEVHWFKNGVEIKMGGRYQIKKDGLKRYLIITGLTMEDMGEYTIEAGIKKKFKSSAKLAIEAKPVKIEKGLKDVSALDKDPELILEATISELEGEVSWLWNGKPIPKEHFDSGKFKMVSDKKKRKLVITNVGRDDTGEYTLVTKDGKSSCKVSVSDRPVKIKSGLRDVSAREKDPEVILEAEISIPDGEVTWLWNGQAIPADLLSSGRFQIISDGRKRKLKIKDPEKAYCGEFTLVTNSGESKCKLDISDRKIGITSKLKDVNALNKEPEVTLEAEVSEDDGEVSWLKDGKPIPKKLLDSGKVQIIVDGKKRKLKIKDVGKDDAGEYTLKTNAGTSSCNLGVQDRPVKIKSGLKDVKAMDKDPEVTLEAEVSEADGAVTWLKNGKPIPQELLDSGKVQIITDGKKRKLKLKDLGKDDGGEYTLVTNDGKSSCKLNVADRPVNIVSGLRDADVVENSAEAALEAEVSEADGEVTWLKNGKPIPQSLLDSGKLQIVADGKKRKLVIKNPGKDDAGEYTLVTKDGKSNCKINVTDEPVKITKELQPVKVTEGDKAELACEVHKDGAQVQWLKNGKPIPDKDLKNIKIVADGKTHKLIFLDVEPKDSGEYSVKTTGGTSNANVNVKEIPAGFTSSLNGAECEFGEDVTFAVELTKPKAEVKWLLNGKVIDPDRPRGKYEVVADGTKRKLIVKNCNGKDNGEITCVFGDKEATSQLKVNEPVGIKKGLEGSVLKEEEKGKLTVELNREKPGGGDIKWYKNGKEITLGGKYKMQRDGNKCHLLIDPVDLTDNAEFTCMAGDSSTSAKATVDEKPALMTSELQVPEVIEGEKAEFVIGLNKDNKLDKIKWFKDGKEVHESSRIHLQQRGNNYVLVINRAQMEDAGTWSCEIDGSTSKGTFVVNEPPLKITSKLRRIDAIEGEDVKFELEVSRENGEVTWFKDGVEINPAANPDKYEIKVIGLKRVLIVKGCALGDSGQITVVAEKDKKTAVLNVEKPFQMERVPTFTLPLRDTGFFAGKTIVLTVTVSVHPEPDITWTKNGQEILPGGRIRFSKDYGRYTLEILNAQPEDEGEYAVTAVNPFGKDFTSCKVTPKTRGHEEDWYVPLFRRYMVTQEVLEGKDARFECKVNGNPVPEVKWMKGDVEIKDGPRHVITFDGKTAALEVRNVSKEDLGTYTCVITNAAGSQECHADIAFDTGLPERKKKRGARRAAQQEEEIEYRKVTEYELEYDENVNVAGGGKVRKVSEEELHKLFLEVEAEEAERLKLGLTIEEWEIREMERLGLTPEQWNIRKRQRMLLLSQLDMEMRMKLGLDMESATMVDGVASGVGFGRATQVDVHMHGPREPKFKLPLRDTNFLVGGTLTLSVTVNVHPENQVTWYKNGQEIKVGGRIRTGQDFGRYTLTILDASADDIGEYSCASKNPYGNDKCSCQVTIREHGHEEYFSAPLFRRYMVNCDALEGKDGTFTCKINAKPQAEIRWERDDKEIVSDDRHVIQYDGVTATLTIKGVTKSDLGTYHCTATNCAGSVTCHAELALDRDLPIARGRYRAISRTEKRGGGTESFVSLGDVYKFESRRSETRITRESLQVVNGSEN